MNLNKTDVADTENIIHYHRDLIDKYGNGTTGALGWIEADGQRARFDILSRIGDMNYCSVLDAGCGHADLFSFLRSKYPAVTCYGCEQIPELLNVAAQRYKGEAGITLWLGNFLQDSMPLTDYVLASGSLNYRHQEPEFIYRAIQKLYVQCRLGLGFNLLNVTAGRDSLLAAYHPGDILHFCRTLSHKTEWQEGYWETEFTVFVYK